MKQMSSWTCLLVLVSINQLRDQLVLRLNSYPQLERAHAQPAQVQQSPSASYRRQVTEPEHAHAPTPPTPKATIIHDQQATSTTPESMRGQQALPSALPSHLQQQPDSVPLDFQQPPPTSTTTLNTAMNNPDRLDGLGPTRTTRHISRSSVPGPYLAEEDIIPEKTYGMIEDGDWQVICPGMEESIRRLRLQRASL